MRNTFSEHILSMKSSSLRWDDLIFLINQEDWDLTVKLLIFVNSESKVKTTNKKDRGTRVDKQQAVLSLFHIHAQTCKMFRP